MYPNVVCNYKLGAVLGTGNYGQVRLGEHVRTQKQFAIKILPRDILDFNEYNMDVRREMVRYPIQLTLDDNGMIMR